MKLTVDFPERDWKFMQKTYTEEGLTFVPEAIKKECVKAIYKGTPYEERKGTWLIKNRYCGRAHCSECGMVKDTLNLTRYCEDCGAKMEVIPALMEVEE